ncbi:MAG: OB-fold nucleic acid binding domain-containing protein [Candidatus Bilamarchaeaceae archaeon]
MKISELRQGSYSGSVEGEIVKLDEPKELQSKFGKKLVVANGILKDDSGEINIALWNEHATAFAQGDKVRITNGWVSEFKGELKLSPGKNGTIEKI